MASSAEAQQQAMKGSADVRPKSVDRRGRSRREMKELDAQEKTAAEKLEMEARMMQEAENIKTDKMDADDGGEKMGVTHGLKAYLKAVYTQEGLLRIVTDKVEPPQNW